MSAGIKEKVGPALGRIVSGVYIATIQKDGIADGMMASWVGQAAFDPPALMMSVNNSREIKKALTPGDKFTLNVLSKKNMDIFKNFAKPHNENKFEGLALKEGLGHAPVFANAVAYLDLVVTHVCPAGDHSVIIGEIIAGDLLTGEDEPMVHLRKDGFQY